MDDYYAKWDNPARALITVKEAHEVAAQWKDTTQLSNALDAMAFVAEDILKECRPILEACMEDEESWDWHSLNDIKKKIDEVLDGH